MSLKRGRDEQELTQFFKRSYGLLLHNIQNARSSIGGNTMISYSTLLEAANLVRVIGSQGMDLTDLLKACITNNLLEIIHMVCVCFPKQFDQHAVAKYYMACTCDQDRINIDSRYMIERNLVICDSVVLYLLCNAGVPISMFTFEHSTADENGATSEEDEATGKITTLPKVELNILTSTLWYFADWPCGSTYDFVDPIIDDPYRYERYYAPIFKDSDYIDEDRFRLDDFMLSHRETDGLWWRNYRCASFVSVFNLLRLGGTYDVKHENIERSPLVGVRSLLETWSNANTFKKPFTVLNLHEALQLVDLNHPANKTLRVLLVTMRRNIAILPSVYRQLTNQRHLAVFAAILDVLPVLPKRKDDKNLIDYMLDGLNIGFTLDSTMKQLNNDLARIRVSSSLPINHALLNPRSKQRKF